MAHDKEPEEKTRREREDDVAGVSKEREEFFEKEPGSPDPDEEEELDEGGYEETPKTHRPARTGSTEPKSPDEK